MGFLIVPPEFLQPRWATAKAASDEGASSDEERRNGHRPPRCKRLCVCVPLFIPQLREFQNIVDLLKVHVDVLCVFPEGNSYGVLVASA